MDMETYVNKAADLSPGNNTQDYAEKCAKKREKSQLSFCQPVAKRRRHILKQERAVSQYAAETMEGATYQSGVGHDDDADISTIPDPVPRGVFKPVSPSGVPTYIAFDLETTDLIRGDQYPHITQIAARELHTGNSFCVYVIPKIPISPAAERVTKIIMTSETSMTVNSNPVSCETIQTALSDFVSWLSQFINVYLVAHNGRRFDFPILVNSCLAAENLQDLLSSVTGLVDSLPVFKTIYPKRGKYGQEDLARSLLSKEYNAHNAVDDVDCLSELLSDMLSTHDQCLLVKSFTLLDVKHNLLSSKERRKNYQSFPQLVASGIMKTSTAENIASSGLNVQHLQTIFTRNGEDGLYNVFTMKNIEGLPRVTNNKRVLEAVVPKLVAYFENLKSSK